ncbi:hypothetical protein EBR77_01135 [bacterium]|jgi:FKBP-type peptidyl-prolyl cis-trans isomerase (trigger factor)|nr:hypothetical protein [bacterium]NBX78179.1 hypothetical protein [bacterium]
MKQADQEILFHAAQNTPGIYTLSITIPKEIVNTFFQFAAQTQQELVAPAGFKAGSAPIEYIQTHYKKNITHHLQEIALKHFVINTLLQKIRDEKIVLVSDPTLTKIFMTQNQDAVYEFEGIAPHEVYIHSWKNLPFKATQRKKYKDIDNQVIAFLDAEAELEKKYRPQDGVQVGDWVNFNAWITNKFDQPVFMNAKTNLWLKIGDEEPDVVLQEIFVGKKIGDLFITNNANIQNYFCDLYDSPYKYAIEITDILSGNHFSMNDFKHYFKLKSKKDVHNKLIEVFSFTSDISQRRLIAHNALHVIINKNQIRVPQQCIDSQQARLLKELQQKSDYNVYKMQENFNNQIAQMAKKQLNEMIAADQIAFQENISITHEDIRGFLHLQMRPRTKDFIYFAHPSSKMDGQEMPVPTELLKKCALREKALNHIIHHLSK